MRRMRWTWEELLACPAYVRTYCIDFLQMEDEAMARRAREARKGGH